MPSLLHCSRAILLFAATAAAFSPPTSLEVISPAPTRNTRRSSSSSSTVVLQAEQETANRQPWDAFRFLRQSSKFVRPPNPFRRPGEAVSVQPGDVIWSAGGESSSASAVPTFSWAPLDDVVMGGVSSSAFDGATGNWVGTVSSDNSGGFVGIRSTPFDPPLDVAACTGIELRLRGGDGKRFKAVLRDSTEFNGVCWTSSFDVPRGKSGGVVRLPFGKQVPTIFAKTVPGKTFGKDNVVGFQLAYSKFEYDGELNKNFALGDFALQLLEVRTY